MKGFQPSLHATARSAHDAGMARAFARAGVRPGPHDGRLIWAAPSVDRKSAQDDPTCFLSGNLHSWRVRGKKITHASSNRGPDRCLEIGEGIGVKAGAGVKSV